MLSKSSNFCENNFYDNLRTPRQQISGLLPFKHHLLYLGQFREAADFLRQNRVLDHKLNEGYILLQINFGEPALNSYNFKKNCNA